MSKTYYNRISIVAHAAASAAALVAAVGASIGYYHITENLFIAILAGIGIASILGLGWFALITAASRARRVGGMVTIALVGVVLVGVALGTSGWALATAIGGETALKVHNLAQIDAYEDALQQAHQRAMGQTGVINAMDDAAAVYTGYAEAEARGDLGGGAGCGARCRSYQSSGAMFSNAAASARADLEGAHATYTEAMTALAQARMQADPAPALAAAGETIVALNAVDIDTSGIGIVEYTGTANGVQNVAAEGLTQAVADADAPLGDPVPVPAYQRITRAEATGMYADRIVGAWIAAIAIDVAPLLMLVIVMALFSEPLLRTETRPRERTSDEEIRVREDNVIGLREAGE